MQICGGGIFSISILGNDFSGASLIAEDRDYGFCNTPVFPDCCSSLRRSPKESVKQTKKGGDIVATTGHPPLFARGFQFEKSNLKLCNKAAVGEVSREASLALRSQPPQSSLRLLSSGSKGRSGYGGCEGVVARSTVSAASKRFCTLVVLL